MLTAYSRHDLADAFSLIDGLGVAHDDRARTALVLRLDEWLTFDSPITLPEDDTYSESGHFVAARDGRHVWLLPGGRFLTVPADVGAPVVEQDVSDPDAPIGTLMAHLRDLALAQYLDGGFDDLPPATVPVVVRDMADVILDLLPDSRAFLLRSLCRGMRRGEGWDTAFARLRACFERGLVDHDDAVVAIAAQCLVRLAAGLGPIPPAGDPRRGVIVLFVSPRTEVRRSALAAMDALPPDRLAELVEVCGNRLEDCLGDADAETRRLAGSVLRRGEAEDALIDAARRLESNDPDARRSVLDGLAELPDDRLALLLAPAVQALADDDDVVHEAAESALRRAATRPEVQHPLLVGLLTSEHQRAVHLGLALLGSTGQAINETLADGLHEILEGPWADMRPRAVELLADRYVGATPEEALEGYEALLRHSDSEVRRVALRRIARDVADRVSLREALFPVLMEHLHDPHPELRVEAALTVVELGYPGAPTIATQLAYDPDVIVRSGVAFVVSRSGDGIAIGEAARIVGLVNTLFEFASSGTGDDRLHWKAALDALTETPNARTSTFLVDLLAAAPDDVGDPFLQYAFGEIDSRLLGLLPAGHDLVAVCRRLVLPPNRHVKHAARLAGARAAHDPLAFDFLWTLYTAGERGDREAARAVLAAVASENKSAEVVETMTDLAAEASVLAERDLLRTLLSRKGGS